MSQVNTGKSVIELKYDHREVDWLPREPLLQKLESEGIVKEVLPLHGILLLLLIYDKIISSHAHAK